MKPIMTLTLCAALSFVTVGAQNTTADAYLRVVNAAIATTAVDVYLGGQRLSSSVKFGSATDFLTVSPARHSLKITKHSSARAVLLSAQISSQAGKYYTVALTEPARALRALVFVAQNIAPGAMTNVELPEKPEPAAEADKEEQAEVAARALKAKLTVYHLAPNAPRVDVIAPGAKPLIAQIAFGQVHVARCKAVAMTLKVTPSATRISPTPSSASLKPGQSYSVFIFPAATSPSFQVKILETRVATQRR